MLISEYNGSNRYDEENFKKFVGLNLKEARLNCALGFNGKKITQEDVAKILDISNSQIAHYEAGRRTPGLKKFTEICTLYGVEPSDVLGQPMLFDKNPFIWRKESTDKSEVYNCEVYLVEKPEFISNRDGVLVAQGNLVKILDSSLKISENNENSLIKGVYLKNEGGNKPHLNLIYTNSQLKSNSLLVEHQIGVNSNSLSKDFPLEFHIKKVVDGNEISIEEKPEILRPNFFGLSA